MSNRASKLVGVGLAPLAASQVAGDAQTGVVAAGTTQATATPVYGDNVHVGTAAASSGVILSGNSSFGPGDTVFVQNAGANAVLIYPPVGTQINALGANAGFSLASNGSAFLVCMGAIGGVLQFFTK